MVSNIGGVNSLCQAGTTPGGGLRFSRMLHWFRPENSVWADINQFTCRAAPFAGRGCGLHDFCKVAYSLPLVFAFFDLGTQPAKYRVEAARFVCRAAPDLAPTPEQQSRWAHRSAVFTKPLRIEHHLQDLVSRLLPENSCNQQNRYAPTMFNELFANRPTLAHYPLRTL